MWEALLSGAIMGLIVGVIRLISSVSEKKNALRDDPIKFKSKDAKLDKMIAVLHNKLTSQENPCYRDYDPPKPLIKNLVKTGYAQYSVQQVANNMLEFIGIQENVSICMDDINGNYQHSVVGDNFVMRGSNLPGNQPRQSNNSKPGYYYTAGRNITEIHINKKYNYSADHILAILAHEIAHHFLYIKNIRLDNEEENEKLTDVTAVYLGFGQILLKGYKSIKWISDEKFDGESESYKVNNYKIGYLNVDDIAYVVKKVERIREIAYEKKKKEEIMKEKEKSSRGLINDLFRNINITENLYEHNILVLKILKEKSGKIKDPKDLKIIMENSNEHYLGHIRQKIDSIKETINSTKIMVPDKHAQLLDDINNISATIAYWNSITSKYL